MKKRNVLFLTQAAMIAALYVVLTFIANVFGLANYAVQVRFPSDRFSRAAYFFVFILCNNYILYNPLPPNTQHSGAGLSMIAQFFIINDVVNPVKKNFVNL